LGGLDGPVKALGFKLGRHVPRDKSLKILLKGGVARVTCPIKIHFAEICTPTSAF